MENRTTVYNWGRILTEEQLKEIESAAETLNLGHSTVGQEGLLPPEELRVTNTGFFDKQRHPRIFELGDILCRQANSAFHGFHIDSIGDAQLAVYEGDKNAHYDWHTDIGWGDSSMYDRKISAIVILSNPEEYEGGDVEFDNGEKYGSLERGTVITFPSYLRHKVHPVTEGIRVSLVFWVEGPRFR